MEKLQIFTGQKWSRTTNCYTLVQGYYPFLPDIKFSLYEPEFFLATAQEYGFIQVELQNIQPNDVIISKEPTHLQVYIGNNKIHHHEIKRLSCVESITPEYIQNIFAVVRRNI